MNTALFSSNIMRLAKTREITFGEAAAFAAEIGYRGVQLSATELKNVPPADYRENLSAAGMKAVCVHCFCRFAASDDALFAAELERVGEVCREASEVGAEFLMLIPAAAEDIDGLSDKRRAAERIVRGTRVIVKRADELGISAVFENFSKSIFPFCTPEELLFMTDAVPGLGICFDNGNFLCVGEDMLSCYERLKNRFSLAHIKNWRYSDKGTPLPDGRFAAEEEPQRGILPNPELLKRMRSDGFDGWYVAEYFGQPSDGDNLRQMSETFEMLSKQAQ